MPTTPHHTLLSSIIIPLAGSMSVFVCPLTAARRYAGVSAEASKMHFIYIYTSTVTTCNFTDLVSDGTIPCVFMPIASHLDGFPSLTMHTNQAHLRNGLYHCQTLYFIKVQSLHNRCRLNTQYIFHHGQFPEIYLVIIIIMSLIRI